MLSMVITTTLNKIYSIKKSAFKSGHYSFATNNPLAKFSLSPFLTLHHIQLNKPLMPPKHNPKCLGLAKIPLIKFFKIIAFVI